MLHRATKTWPDLVVAAAIGVSVAAYWNALPPSLGKGDESFFLVEAARIRNGEVLYRDIFQFVTPLASWAMALCFWAFGTTAQTARMVTSVLHALTCMAVYAACRGSAVRRFLAVAAAVAYLVVGPPTWPFASWHWFATLATTALLACLLTGGWASRGGAAFVAGLLVGLLVGIQQQKGVVFAAAVSLLFWLDPLCDRRFGTAPSTRQRARRLLAFGAGVALIALPVLLACVYGAGAERVYDDLVRFPLQTYREKNQIGWGEHRAALGVAFRHQIFPSLLRWAPLALLPVALRAAALFARGRERRPFRALATLLIFSLASIASIAYFPDYIHIAFITPVFAVCAAQGVQWALAPLAHRPTVAGAFALAIAAAVIATAAPRLAANLATARTLYPYESETAFGRVAFSNRWEPLFVEGTRDLLRASGSDELFCYPNVASPYLTVGAKNPTPFQFLLASFSPPEHTREALEILGRRELPFIILSPLLKRPGDPIVEYIQKHYSYASLPEAESVGVFPQLWLLRRNETTAP